MAHQVEHGVDMDTGAVVSVTVQDASEGDTATLPETRECTLHHLASAPLQATTPPPALDRWTRLKCVWESPSCLSSRAQRTDFFHGL